MTKKLRMYSMSYTSVRRPGMLQRTTAGHHTLFAKNMDEAKKKFKGQFKNSVIVEIHWAKG